MNKPDLYAEANAMGRCDISDFADEFSDQIREMSGRCLDIGSGPGDAIVDLILPRLPTEASLVYSDISEKNMNYAKEKYKDIPRLSFIQLNIETPDLSDDLKEQFDHITSSYCLQSVRDMRQALTNILNLLRPGGTVLSTFIHTSPIDAAWKNLSAVPRYQPYMQDVDQHVSIYQYVERAGEILKNLLKEVGFQIHHFSVRERSYIYDEPNVLKKVIVSVTPFMDRMPAEVKEEFLKDIVNEVEKLNIIFDQKNADKYKICFRYRMFRVYLEKPLSN